MCRDDDHSDHPYNAPSCNPRARSATVTCQLHQTRSKEYSKVGPCLEMLPLPSSAKTGDGKKVGLDHDVDRCARRCRTAVDSFFYGGQRGADKTDGITVL